MTADFGRYESVARRGEVMTLAQIYSRIWDCLTRAAADAPPQPSSFSTVQAATVGPDGSPRVRTVLLRGVNEPDGRLALYTDRRSPKIAELGRDPRIALVGVDAMHNMQIRVTGEASILLDEGVRRLAWKSSSDQSRRIYRTTLGPGTPIDNPEDAFAKGHGADEMEGFANFCVVEVRVNTLEWLKHSANERHERARYVRNGDGWEAGWITP